MLARKKIFGLPIAMVALVAIVVAVAALAGNATTAAPVAADHRGSYDADCRDYHYKVTNIPSSVSKYVEKVCFAKNGGIYDGAWIYLTDQGWRAVLFTLTAQGEIARWVVNHPYWLGTRSSYSVQSELFYHALEGRGKTHPTHVEYHCSGLPLWQRYLYGC